MLQLIHFLKYLEKDLSENVWVVALIVYRFRDDRQKYQHRRLNSYRGDYNCGFLDVTLFCIFRLLASYLILFFYASRKTGSITLEMNSQTPLCTRAFYCFTKNKFFC